MISYKTDVETLKLKVKHSARENIRALDQIDLIEPNLPINLTSKK